MARHQGLLGQDVRVLGRLGGRPGGQQRGDGLAAVVDLAGQFVVGRRRCSGAVRRRPA
ncbi:predicted protein [Streptomyces sp. C]|nr:predicted protein [Streptomyces sp. C]